MSDWNKVREFLRELGMWFWKTILKDELAELVQVAIPLVLAAQEIEPEGDDRQRWNTKFKFVRDGLKEWAEEEGRQVKERLISLAIEIAVSKVKDGN